MPTSAWATSRDDDLHDHDPLRHTVPGWDRDRQRGPGNITENTFTGVNINDVRVTKQGTGTWTLQGTGNTYHGPTLANGGTLVLGTGAFLGNTSQVTLQSGVLDLAGIRCRWPCRELHRRDAAERNDYQVRRGL